MYNFLEIILDLSTATSNGFLYRPMLVFFLSQSLKPFQGVPNLTFLLDMISGGLAEEVDDKMLQAAFIPFGDILDVNIPIDYETSKHRGFAFLEYELPEDAAAAIDNMNESELCGRTVRVNIAKPMKNKEGASRAVWNSDEWLQEHAATEGVDKENKDKSGESKNDNDASDDVTFLFSL